MGNMEEERIITTKCSGKTNYLLPFDATRTEQKTKKIEGIHTQTIR
jgi:hypothetical protein